MIEVKDKRDKVTINLFRFFRGGLQFLLIYALGVILGTQFEFINIISLEFLNIYYQGGFLSAYLKIFTFLLLMTIPGYISSYAVGSIDGTLITSHKKLNFNQRLKNIGLNFFAFLIGTLILSPLGYLFVY